MKYVNTEFGSLENYDKHFSELLKVEQENLNNRKPIIEKSEKLVDIDLNREIFIVSNQIWIELIKEFSKSPYKLKKIDRRAFEQLVAFLFKNFGYDVELTGRTRDGGRDIIAIKKREVYAKYLIECKRPDPGNKIGIRPVRELYGVKVDEGASKAILATTSYFTKDAHVFMERHKWELEPRDFDGVMEWISSYDKFRQ
jgi:restriction endonuclease Mrr